jgi:hypothetical protein
VKYFNLYKRRILVVPRMRELNQFTFAKGNCHGNYLRWFNYIAFPSQAVNNKD